MANFPIKQLGADDWQILKNFRLEALKNSPESFGSSYEEELNWINSDFQNSFTKSDIFGVFVDNSLISCAGFYSLNSAKTKHRGVIWGMYTRPECRGQGYRKHFNSNHYQSRKVTCYPAALNLCDKQSWRCGILSKTGI